MMWAILFDTTKNEKLMKEDIMLTDVLMFYSTFSDWFYFYAIAASNATISKTDVMIFMSSHKRGCYSAKQ